MIESPSGRAGALFALLAVLFGLLVWYGTLGPAPAAGVYPGDERVVSEPDRYVGQRVAVAGEVVAVDPVRIEVETDGVGRRTFELRSLDLDPREGDGVRVFGTLTDRETLTVIDAFVVPPGGLLYTYAVSFLAGLWALSLVVRTYRIDRERLALVPRSDPVTLDRLLDRRRSAGDELGGAARSGDDSHRGGDGADRTDHADGPDGDPGGDDA